MRSPSQRSSVRSRSKPLLVLRYQFDPKFGMFACREILPELIARFEALDEVCRMRGLQYRNLVSLLLRMGVGRWT